MTTPAKEALYQAQHVAEHESKGWAVYNPHEKAVADLPVIYGFNNGRAFGGMDAVLLAEDGTFLGSHICSAECYMPHDLGVLDEVKSDRHEGFREHYPNGYRMVFLTGEQVKAGHDGLNRAVELNWQKTEECEGQAQ